MSPPNEGLVDAPTLLARSFARLGLSAMFGVVGIPVTQVATAAQAAGIRYFGFRNEQPAGYAAAAHGYLTGVPGVLLTVSGPGCVHGLAGLSHAAVNAWPMVMVSGSCTQGDVGKGDFQELDQIQTVKQFAKYAGKATKLQDLPGIVKSAVLAAVQGRPGATYIDLPSDVLHETLTPEAAEEALSSLSPTVPLWAHPSAASLLLPAPEQDKVKAAVSLLRGAQRPLLIVGPGVGYGRAEGELKKFVEHTQIPFVPTPIGKGTLPDSHPLCAGAARSLALSKADVSIVVGAPLNWQLHFGEPPKWAQGVQFILVDVDKEEIDKRSPAVGIVGEPKEVLAQLLKELKVASGSESGTVLDSDPSWRQVLKEKVEANSKKLSSTLSASPFPLNFHAPLRVLREVIAAEGSPAPILVSEGANTMDIGRSVLDQSEPRTRLDAAIWGTMGVGLGYAVGAAQAEPSRLIVALEGDSAFGFSGMEVETIARYKLPVVIIVMNNSGVYGGDRRTSASAVGFVATDPAPTDFVPNARYDKVMEALGGKGYFAETIEEFEAAVKSAFSQRQPSLINVVIDPFAGVESGRMTHKN